jgi:cyclophilin family peptidyl-prolyl cis-trans isomerase
MIRLAALTLAVLALVPMSPLGCPPAEVPPEEILPTERATLATTAEGPATAAVAQLVQLQASVVPRADSGRIYYSWLQIAGLGVPIVDANRAAARFNAPSLPTTQPVRFIVTTRDEAGAVGRAEVTVVVSADPNYGHPTTQPSQTVADAGADQWALAGEQVTLDGSQSTGTGLAYRWRAVSGAPVTFSTPDAAQTTFQAPAFDPNDTSPLVLELIVTDATGQQVTDRTQVKVGDPSLSDRNVQIETTKGNIVLELDRAKAPVTVGNFLWYIDDGFYDGTIIHRVIADFVIQGGGYLADLTERTTRAAIINEASNGLSNVRGTSAMARTSDPDSATSQFFINLKDNIAGGDGASDLDPGGVTPEGYAVFGQVTQGMDVVDAIAAVETGTREGFQDVPVEDVIVTTIRRLPVGQ